MEIGTIECDFGKPVSILGHPTEIKEIPGRFGSPPGTYRDLECGDRGCNCNKHSGRRPLAHSIICHCDLNDSVSSETANGNKNKKKKQKQRAFMTSSKKKTATVSNKQRNPSLVTRRPRRPKRLSRDDARYRPSSTTKGASYACRPHDVTTLCSSNAI